jgi:CBS domain-containing protein
MTDSTKPEGEAVRESSEDGANANAGADQAPAAAPPESPTAEPVAAPVTTRSGTDDDDGRESIEVESVTMESQKPSAAKLATHHPPPPPSFRARGAGTRGHFDVSGTPKLAQDLMSRKIFTIGPDDKLLHLEEHMEKFRFGHLPVVKDDKLVGLITHADLLHASASFLTQKAKEIDEIVHNFPASRIMRRDIVTVKPTDTLADVAKLMWDAKVDCVLVTEGADKLVGIITEGDFIRLAHHFLTEKEK